MGNAAQKSFDQTNVTSITSRRLLEAFAPSALPLSPHQANVIGKVLDDHHVALMDRYQETDYNALLFTQSIEQRAHHAYIIISETSYNLLQLLKSTDTGIKPWETEQMASWLLNAGKSFVQFPRSKDEIVWNNTCGSALQVFSKEKGQWINRDEPEIRAMAESAVSNYLGFLSLS